MITIGANMQNEFSKKLSKILNKGKVPIIIFWIIISAFVGASYALNLMNGSSAFPERSYPRLSTVISKPAGIAGAATKN